MARNSTWKRDARETRSRAELASALEGRPVSKPGAGVLAHPLQDWQDLSINEDQPHLTGASTPGLCPVAGHGRKQRCEARISLRGQKNPGCLL